MKKVATLWKEGDPMPLAGWLLIGSISTVLALVSGSFMSLAFYYFRGWIALPLYYLQPEWISRDGDLAWTLGFATGVLMSLFGKHRWKKSRPGRKMPRPKEKTKTRTETSLGSVVKRTLGGTLAGFVIGLFLALVLEMMFFSASLSPFGPSSWKAAVQTEWRQESGLHHETERTSLVISSSHPLFKYLFFVPTCGMTIAGGLVGGTTGLHRWLRALKTARPRW